MARRPQTGRPASDHSRAGGQEAGASATRRSPSCPRRAVVWASVSARGSPWARDPAASHREPGAPRLHPSRSLTTVPARGGTRVKQGHGGCNSSATLTLNPLVPAPETNCSHLPSPHSLCWDLRKGDCLADQCDRQTDTDRHTDGQTDGQPAEALGQRGHPAPAASGTGVGARIPCRKSSWALGKARPPPVTQPLAGRREKGQFLSTRPGRTLGATFSQPAPRCWGGERPGSAPPRPAPGFRPDKSRAAGGSRTGGRPWGRQRSSSEPCSGRTGSADSGPR